MTRGGKFSLGILGVALSLGGIWFVEMYSKLKTGVPALDRFDIRGRALAWSLFYAVDPKAVMAIVHNESGGNPSNYLGDIDAATGPSIGPMQVSRGTAKDLGLWTPPEGLADEDERALFADMADDEDQGIRWGIAVFKAKLAGRDGDVGAAIKAYNGAGSRADAYLADARKFLSDTYGASI